MVGVWWWSGDCCCACSVFFSTGACLNPLGSFCMCAGQADPGPPERADTSRKRTYKTKQETDKTRNVTGTIVLTLLGISVVVPMLQYWGAALLLCRALLACGPWLLQGLCAPDCVKCALALLMALWHCGRVHGQGLVVLLQLQAVPACAACMRLGCVCQRLRVDCGPYVMHVSTREADWVYLNGDGQLGVQLRDPQAHPQMYSLRGLRDLNKM